MSHTCLKETIFEQVLEPVLAGIDQVVVLETACVIVGVQPIGLH